MTNACVKVTTTQCPCCLSADELSIGHINVPVEGHPNFECTVVECELCYTEVALCERDGHSFAMFTNGPLVNDTAAPTFPRQVDGQFQVSADHPRILLDDHADKIIQKLGKLLESALVHPLFRYFVDRLQESAQPLLTDDGQGFTSERAKDAYESLFGNEYTPASLQEFTQKEFNTVMFCPDSGAYLVAMRDSDGRYTNFYTTVLTETVENSDIIPVAVPVFGWALWECNYLHALKNISVAD
jgi:hypothetical protein